MITIDKPKCFANIKIYNCNSLICKGCQFYKECCKEINEGRGTLKNLKIRKSKRDFNKTKLNGKIFDLNLGIQVKY